MDASGTTVLVHADRVVGEYHGADVHPRMRGTQARDLDHAGIVSPVDVTRVGAPCSDGEHSRRVLASVAVTRLLIVDDDANLRDTLGYSFRREGFEVITAEDGEQALAAFRQAHPDLVVLDVMLPGKDGFEVCRALRRESEIPVIMLTARDTELDKVVGLEIGADDYLAKPFSTRELVARVRAMLRRTRRAEPSRADARLEVEGLLLDAGRHRVMLQGREIELKPKEFDLLAFFMGHAGQVFGREQLLASVWGYDFAGDSRTVDTHVKTLRDKLGDDASRPQWIETVRGVGYRFRDQIQG